EQGRAFVVPPISPWLTGAIAAFALIWLWSAIASRPTLTSIPLTRLLRLGALTYGLGIGATLIALLPPALVYAPIYTSRFMAWASFAAIALVTVIVLLLQRVHWRLGTLAALLMTTALVWGMAVQVYAIGDYYRLPNLGNRRFWQDVTV